MLRIYVCQSAGARKTKTNYRNNIRIFDSSGVKTMFVSSPRANYYLQPGQTTYFLPARSRDLQRSFFDHARQPLMRHGLLHSI
eukprot:16434689-Heterocapsa_arctica.AAC.1